MLQICFNNIFQTAKQAGRRSHETLRFVDMRCFPLKTTIQYPKWSTQTFDLFFQMILFITIFWAIVCFAGPKKWMYFHVFLTCTVSQETHKGSCPEIGPQLNETHWNDQSGDPPKIQEKSEFHFKFKPVQMRLISKQSLSGFKAAKYKFRSNYVKSPVSQIYKSDRFRIRSNSESSLTVKKTCPFPNPKQISITHFSTQKTSNNYGVNSQPGSGLGAAC